MNITYEEYLKLVPESTKKLVEATLPYLWIYVKRGKSIKLKNTDSCYTTGKMPLAISGLLGAAQDPEIKAMFEGKGFKPNRLNITQEDLPKLSAAEKKEIFEQSLELFMPYSDITKYTTIQPIDIINRALNLDNGDYYFKEMLNYVGVTSELKSHVSSLVKSSVRNQELQLERELFEHLPISVINYIETATKIRSIILSQFKNGNTKEQELLKYDDSYIVPISLLFALYEYEGQEKQEIVDFFRSKGLSLDAIRRHISVSNLDIRSTNRNLESAKVLYKKYWTEGANYQQNNIQVVDVLGNVLDRNFTGVITIDKLFERVGTSTSDFSDLKTSIEAATARKKADEEMNYARSFYKELRRDTKDFINLTTQTYQLLLKKMQTGKHNTEILNCEDDADTLALYIASHFYNTDFEQFYVAHGVTFEKVMELLGLTITREEIEQEELNQKIVVDRFKRFVLSGVNSNSRPERILVNDVANNLCNRDFNRSMIMENIFEEIRRDIDLPANFMSNLEKYLKDKETARKRKLTEEYFSDKSNDIYVLLEAACKAYKTLTYSLSNQDYQDEELVPLSLLYAVINTYPEFRELYAHIGITKQRLNKYLNIDFERYIRGELDIDLIINKFDPYIKSQQEKDKPTLSITDISQNIINSKRPKTLQLTRLLAQYDLTYESFDDFTKAKTELEQQKQEQQLIEQAKTNMSGWSSNATDMLKDATKTFQVLSKTKSEDMPTLTTEDMIELSMLLSILRRPELDSYQFFGKYNISEQDILNLLNLPKDLRSKSAEQDFNAKCFLDYFSKYANSDQNNRTNANDLVNILLGQNSSLVKKSLEALGVDYEIFKHECLTRKDYESTLSIDDRVAILDRTPTPSLSLESTSSIAEYGSELANHTTFINDQCTEIVLADPGQEATKTIKDVLERVYEKKKIPVRQQTWFERLVGTEVETKEEITVNGPAITDLKSTVSNYIRPLYNDIKTFDSLARYLEVYRRKVLEHRDKAEEMLERLREEQQKVSEDDFEKMLRLKTYIKAVESKRDGFVLTDHLVKQYIYKTYLVMENDLVTITGLEMSRDVLIPMLEAEAMLGQSLQNQSDGATVTECIVELLGEVVNKNAQGIEQSLSAIKRSGVSEEKLSALSRDIAKYLIQISETTDPDTILIEKLPVEKPILELPNSPKQKKYTSKQ